MALLNSINNYIKLNEDDVNFTIYKNRTNRNNEKNAQKNDLYNKIDKKYNELINEARNNLHDFIRRNNIPPSLPDENIDYYDKLYPGLKDLIDTCAALINEQNQYTYDLQQKNGNQHDYKIIKTYFPQIDKIIPNIISSGFILLHGSDVHELYEDAKNKKIFGETTDC